MGNIFLSLAKKIALTLFLCLIVTLYMAPSKESTADLMVVSLMVILLGTSAQRVNLRVNFFTSLTPLFFLLLYVALSCVLTGLGWDFAKMLLFGLLVFLLFYSIFRHQSPSTNLMVILMVLLIPGLIHLGYLFYDIGRALWYGDISFASSSRQGILEHLKNAPRVGRRYVSLSLIHLLGGALLMSWYYRLSSLRYLAWILLALGLLSLAVMDARAAYVSVFIGAALLCYAVGIKRVRRAWKNFLPNGYVAPLVVVGVLGIAAVAGYSAGKSRWLSLDYSLFVAMHDVFVSEVPLPERPFVDARYWDEPINNPKKCYLEKEFRCAVDQSAYLRFAWLLSGIKSLMEFPIGVGHSKNYMARMWNVADLEGRYQHNDSFLVELGVAFGFPGLLLYGWLVWGVVRSLQMTTKEGNASVALMVIAGLVLISFGRSFVDQFNEGLWRYLMVLLGVYYGVLHSVEGGGSYIKK